MSRQATASVYDVLGGVGINHPSFRQLWHPSLTVWPNHVELVTEHYAKPTATVLSHSWVISESNRDLSTQGTLHTVHCIVRVDVAYQESVDHCTRETEVQRKILHDAFLGQQLLVVIMFTC